MSDDIGQSVRDRLAATTEVTALVRSRIYADVLPMEVDLPALTVAVTGNTPHEDVNSTNRIYQSQVLIVAYGNTRAEANALAKHIRNSALPADLSGRVEEMEWSECSLVSGPAEAVEAPTDNSDRWRRVTTQEFVIWNSPV